MKNNLSELGVIFYFSSLIVLSFVLYIRFRRQRNNSPFDPTPKEILDTLTKMSIKKEKYTRSLDDERVFMEDLLVKRFNFLILIFSIFFAAGLSVQGNIIKSIILFIGFIFCYAMAEVTKRAHYKHHWIMRVLYGEKVAYPKNLAEWSNHPVRIINQATKKPDDRKRKSSGSVSLLNGYFLPNLTVFILLFSSLFYLYNYIISNDKTTVDIKFLDTQKNIKNVKGVLYRKDDKNFIIVNDSLFSYKIEIKE
jgi:hypothetical protein